MPRRARGPRLYLDPQRRQWAIRDGANFYRTGCAESELKQAEEKLAEYIGSKYSPPPSPAPLIADILLAYKNEHVPGKASKDKIEHTISNLEKFWGDKRLADVTKVNCRSFAGRGQSLPVDAIWKRCGPQSAIGTKKERPHLQAESLASRPRWKAPALN